MHRYEVVLSSYEASAPVAGFPRPAAKFAQSRRIFSLCTCSAGFARSTPIAVRIAPNCRAVRAQSGGARHPAIASGARKAFYLFRRWAISSLRFSSAFLLAPPGRVSASWRYRVSLARRARSVALRSITSLTVPEQPRNLLSNHQFRIPAAAYISTQRTDPSGGTIQYSRECVFGFAVGQLRTQQTCAPDRRMDTLQDVLRRRELSVVENCLKGVVRSVFVAASKRHHAIFAASMPVAAALSVPARPAPACFRSDRTSRGAPTVPCSVALRIDPDVMMAKPPVHRDGHLTLCFRVQDLGLDFLRHLTSWALQQSRSRLPRISTML